ncbi:hypothetical protein V1511DRAFT_370022 [Dipodascopsis uninucleata]
MSMQFFPQVKPSAIALGTAFSHGSGLLLSAPVFGSAYERARKADTPEEFIKTKEAASALSVWGSSLVGSAIKTYAVSVILQSTGTLTNKGALYIGSLLFAIQTVPNLLIGVFQEKRPLDYVVAKLGSQILDTIGLSFVLNWWGTRPDLA